VERARGGVGRLRVEKNGEVLRVGEKGEGEGLGVEVVKVEGGAKGKCWEKEGRIKGGKKG
jgi:hypothetical protein